MCTGVITWYLNSGDISPVSRDSLHIFQMGYESSSLQFFSTMAGISLSPLAEYVPISLIAFLMSSGVKLRFSSISWWVTLIWADFFFAEFGSLNTELLMHTDFVGDQPSSWGLVAVCFQCLIEDQ